MEHCSLSLREYKLQRTARLSANSARPHDPNPLKMAIVTESGAELESIQSESAIYELSSLLIQELNKPVVAIRPQFRGKPLRIRGAVLVWCENEETSAWLESAVLKIRETWYGPALKVVKACELPKLVRCGLMLPHRMTTLNDIRNMLIKQNDWAECQTWRHYHTKVVKNRTSLMFGIPDYIVKRLLERERRLSYMFGSVYIQFFNPDNTLSNVPPDDDVERKTDPNTPQEEQKVKAPVAENKPKEIPRNNKSRVRQRHRK